jgi:oxalate decarboxylase/phosphoglucose isomerase-like protein (cupin superfamily)
MNLSELLHPVSIGDIRGAIDRGEVTHFKRGPGAPGAELMNYDIVARLSDRLGALGKLRVTRNGVPVPPEMMRGPLSADSFSGATLRNLTRKGVSVVTHGMEDYDPALADVALEVERWMGCRPTIGFIATFGEGCALKGHWDPEDVFTIQIAGTKKWMILGERHRGRLNERSQSDPPAEITREIAVEPGDILVVPRGFWHRCHGDGSTLQLTVLMYRFTGADYIKALARKAAEDPVFHRAMPLDRESPEFAELDAEWRARFAELVRSTPLSGIAAADDRRQEIPAAFDGPEIEPAAAGARLELATRRPLALPLPGEAEIRMSNCAAPATPAVLAVARILNREVCVETRELFQELAGEFGEQEIAEAIRALDRSCLARLRA